MAQWRCEECENFEFDEETQEDICVVDMDMDEFERYLLSDHGVCPYFRLRDDYRIVRKQN